MVPENGILGTKHSVYREAMHESLHMPGIYCTVYSPTMCCYCFHVNNAVLPSVLSASIY